MAILSLSQAQKDQFAEVLNSGPGLVGARKNLGIVIAVLNEFVDRGYTSVATKEVEAVVRGLNLHPHWNEDPNGNRTGLTKALGDCMGAHKDALQLKKTASAQYRGKSCNGYVLPAKPERGPAITDEWLIARGLDPETCRHEALTAPPRPEEPAPSSEDATESEPPASEGEVEDLLAQLDEKAEVANA